jgi:site-specific DNA-methyltransferase (adenine-specific)
MREIPDESVHLVVTSPPYWQLKDYGNEGQVGFNDTYEDYINNLNLVWNECHRVLYKGCRLCVNIGDQFARSVYYGRYKVIPIRTEIIKFCETIGFDYMGAVIWRKVTTCNTSGGATIMGSFPYPRNGILKLDYEFILIFKKYGMSPKAGEEAKEKSKLTVEEWNEYFSGHWNFPGEKQDRHLAMFPEELPKRLIRMFTFVGDTVLDPFLGSGTTSLVAKKLGRNSIGYEINQEFVPAILEKVGIKENVLFREAAFEVIKSERPAHDFREDFEKLAYRFVDPVKFDKKVDPRTLQFGSRINGDDPKREEYHGVKDILSPEIIVLTSGLKVRLLGVRTIQEKKAEAVGYLRDKTRGQRVYLRYDFLKHDEDDTLLCYVYLENRTFLNAHLIKDGLADVDIQLEYKYKARFLSKRIAV